MNCATCKYRYKDPIDGNICTCNPVPVANPKVGYTLKFLTCEEKNFGETCYDYSDGLDIILVYIGQALAVFCACLAIFGLFTNAMIFFTSLFGMLFSCWIVKMADRF